MTIPTRRILDVATSTKSYVILDGPLRQKTGKHIRTAQSHMHDNGWNNVIEISYYASDDVRRGTNTLLAARVRGLRKQSVANFSVNIWMSHRRSRRSPMCSCWPGGAGPAPRRVEEPGGEARGRGPEPGEDEAEGEDGADPAAGVEVDVYEGASIKKRIGIERRCQYIDSFANTQIQKPVLRIMREGEDE